MKRRALFLDRDGTLVHPRHYPSRPEELHLYDDIESPLRVLQQAGFQLVLITNQAGIARGYFTEADLERMHKHLSRELEQRGVRLDGIYYCPHHPQGVIPELAVHCDCRKPQPGMLLRAAENLNLDLQSSWFVGDILDDIEAGKRAGCRTVLVDLGTEERPHSQIRCPDFVAQDTAHALQIICACTKSSGGASPDQDSPGNLMYYPSRWQTNCEDHPSTSCRGLSGAKQSMFQYFVPTTDLSASETDAFI